MSTYIIKRLLAAIPVLLGVSIVAFALVRLVPGDPVTILLGPGYNEQQAAVLRERYALDRPLPMQYVAWVSRAVRGDLGESFFTGQPVLRAMIERLPVTLELTAIGILFAIFVGVPLGIASAIRPGRFVDHAARMVGLLGISVPGFWLGTILILFVSLRLGWLPSGRFVPLWEDPIENLRRMLLPGLALGTAVAAVVMRTARSAVLEVVRQDYVRTARAKGLGERAVLVRHALRNALVPVVTVIGLQAGYLLGGSVVIEQVFALPGLGRLALQAITSRDYALLQGTVLFVAVAFVMVNLLVDLLYAKLDPRISYGGK
ncbi:MAG TPA: ABC transporter permease [Tepidisphaeraceae bacterium]|nr:ABC transporter permease [Tepidisphaeraceae bacterium]